LNAVQDDLMPDHAPQTPPSAVQARHQDLRARLTDIAEETIRSGGLPALKARDLARQAGCAVGAIYTVFDDLNGVVMAVNGRTFRSLGLAVAGAIEAHRDLGPTDRLISMSNAYLRFAMEHPRLWRTLFDLQMSVDQKVPDWYLAELGRLFAYIAAPLRDLFPQMEAVGIDLMTRTLFSSVHGIVLLGLEKRISGVPAERIEEMIALLLHNVTSRA
jgi:AcrR family transcriptional regulator